MLLMLFMLPFMLPFMASQHPQLSRPAVHERADAGAVVRVGHDEPQHAGRGADSA